MTRIRRNLPRSLRNLGLLTRNKTQRLRWAPSNTFHTWYARSYEGLILFLCCDLWLSQGVQEGQIEYPKPVQDLYNMAGVLNAVPYDGSPVIKDSKDLPLMPELSPYQWSEEGPLASSNTKRMPDLTNHIFVINIQPQKPQMESA